MIVIFAGPTITAQQVHEIVEDATVMPPASMGDVFKAAQNMPKAIGIIDGYFDGVPSIWHKEILWALDMGVSVFGAASMGALRAAELQSFGMIGVGQIYESFKDGVLEDDDEVALQHGPEELEFAPLSEPMVNIRFTVKRACEERIINDQTASELVQLAKRKFYPERNWDSLAEDALQHGIASNEVERLKVWLPEGIVDQKRIDALAMLSAIKDFHPNRETGRKQEFEFQHTVMWDRLQREINNDALPGRMALVLDCLRCDQSKYDEYRSRAGKALLAKMGGESISENVSSDQKKEALSRFRVQHKLFTAQSMNDWLLENGTDAQQLENNLVEEISIDRLIKAYPDEFRKTMLVELQADGYDTKLIKMAEAVQSTLERSGLQTATADELGLNKIELQVWFFETLMGVPLPDDLDYLLDKNDFSSRREFEAMMVCQYVWWLDHQQQ